MYLKSLAAALVSLALAAACSPKVAAPASAVSGDAFMGPADAKVVLMEFAAPTCPVCKGWHDQVFDKIKTTYVDTGKIKFVLRELPSHNPPVDAAIFGIARCAGQGEYFKVIDEAFAKRDEIEKASMGASGPREALTALAKAHGVSADKFQACVSSPEHVQRILDVQTDAEKRGVSGTPTLFLNDVKLDDSGYTVEGLSAKIEAALGGGAAQPAPAAPAAAAPAPTPAPAKPN